MSFFLHGQPWKKADWLYILCMCIAHMCDTTSLGCNREAMSVALASGASFIRAECFVYSHVADEGWMDASAGELLRHRRTIGGDHVLVLADIKKKHW